MILQILAFLNCKTTSIAFKANYHKHLREDKALVYKSSELTNQRVCNQGQQQYPFQQNFTLNQIAQNKESLDFNFQDTTANKIIQTRTHDNYSVHGGFQQQRGILPIESAFPNNDIQIIDVNNQDLQMNDGTLDINLEQQSFIEMQQKPQQKNRPDQFVSLGQNEEIDLMVNSPTILKYFSRYNPLERLKELNQRDESQNKELKNDASRSKSTKLNTLSKVSNINPEDQPIEAAVNQVKCNNILGRKEDANQKSKAKARKRSHDVISQHHDSQIVTKAFNKQNNKQEQQQQHKEVCLQKQNDTVMQFVEMRAEEQVDKFVSYSQIPFHDNQNLRHELDQNSQPNIIEVRKVRDSKKKIKSESQDQFSQLKKPKEDQQKTEVNNQDLINEKDIAQSNEAMNSSKIISSQKEVKQENESQPKNKSTHSNNSQSSSSSSSSSSSRTNSKQSEKKGESSNSKQLETNLKAFSDIHKKEDSFKEKVPKKKSTKKGRGRRFKKTKAIKKKKRPVGTINRKGKKTLRGAHSHEKFHQGKRGNYKESAPTQVQRQWLFRVLINNQFLAFHDEIKHEIKLTQFLPIFYRKQSNELKEKVRKLSNILKAKLKKFEVYKIECIKPFLPQCGLNYDIWSEAIANYKKGENESESEGEDSSQKQKAAVVTKEKSKFSKQTEIEKLLASSSSAATKGNQKTQSKESESQDISEKRKPRRARVSTFVAQFVEDSDDNNKRFCVGQQAKIQEQDDDSFLIGSKLTKRCLDSLNQQVKQENEGQTNSVSKRRKVDDYVEKDVEAMLLKSQQLAKAKTNSQEQQSQTSKSKSQDQKDENEQEEEYNQAEQEKEQSQSIQPSNQIRNQSSQSSSSSSQGGNKEKSNSQKPQAQRDYQTNKEWENEINPQVQIVQESVFIDKSKRQKKLKAVQSQHSS